MKPIPKNMLVHTAVVKAKNEADIWNESTETEKARLEFIRIEPLSALKVDNQQRQVQVSAVLLYDCRNSLPKNFVFSHEDIIEHDGKRYRIIGIEKLTEKNRLHHVEVSLCL